jgi:hypothetical protein
MGADRSGTPKPRVHGDDHSPGGLDPVKAENWHKCGDADEPVLDPGSVGITGRVWFRLVVGRKALKTQSFELFWVIDGGADGDVITTFPMTYVAWCEGEDVAVNGQDSSGGFRAGYISGASGDFVLGPLP